MTDTEFVETLGVISNVISVDTFALALGLRAPELPEPAAGEPSRRRPAEAKIGPGWVPTIAPEDALPENAFPVRALDTSELPEEAVAKNSFVEGGLRQITVNAYERDPKARSACIKHHGPVCQVCGMNFEEIYGETGRGFIHVHHKRPLSSVRSTYKVDPKKDLVPVCPNCHAMLHKRKPPFDVEQLRAIIDTTKPG